MVYKFYCNNICEVSQGKLSIMGWLYLDHRSSVPSSGYYLSLHPSRNTGYGADVSRNWAPCVTQLRLELDYSENNVLNTTME